MSSTLTIEEKRARLAARQRDYYRRHPEQVTKRKLIANRYRLKHLERLREYDRKRDKNPIRRAAVLASHRRHASATNARNRAAYVPRPKRPLQTKEERRALKIAYYHKTKEKSRLIRQLYYRNNKEKWRTSWHKRPYWKKKYQSGLSKAVLKSSGIGDKLLLIGFYKELFQKTEATCEYCRGLFPIKHITIDHKEPYVLGGKHEVSNLAISCLMCNLKKKAKPYALWKAVLI